jgi:hypothetical protein
LSFPWPKFLALGCRRGAAPDRYQACELAIVDRESQGNFAPVVLDGLWQRLLVFLNRRLGFAFVVYGRAAQCIRCPMIQPVENPMRNTSHLIARLAPAVLAVAATVASLLLLQFALLVA